MRKFEIVKDEFRNWGSDIKLPVRSDNGSAGYDFFSPIDFTLRPGETITIPTDIKVCMEKDEVLLLFVRSSIGIKKHIVLSNGTGVIDSTFYGNDINDGNLCCALTNIGKEEQRFERNDRIMQGVFIKYLITDDDEPLKDKRTGGIGSSGN